jgi:hypothetical protein
MSYTTAAPFSLVSFYFPHHPRLSSLYLFSHIYPYLFFFKSLPIFFSLQELDLENAEEAGVGGQGHRGGGSPPRRMGPWRVATSPTSGATDGKSGGHRGGRGAPARGAADGSNGGCQAGVGIELRRAGAPGSCLSLNFFQC